MSLIRLPGLIDVHVHLRDSGQTHKENFYSGTKAALAGGYTTIIDMPNNKVPITSQKLLQEKINLAKKKIICDVGFYLGSLGNNLEEFEKVKNSVFGIKLYLNITTGKFIINKEKLKKIYKIWPKNLPILVHAEADVLENVIRCTIETGKRTHICHVSTKKEFNIIKKAKEKKLPITCGVTPHHLFLSKADTGKLGSFGLMKPQIEEGFREFIWKNLEYIDVIESDHAPHTVKEKKSSNPPFGVPGLETTLPLLLTAVNRKKFTRGRLIELCFNNPKKIFSIKTDKNTFIEVDPDEEYVIENKNLYTKCGWSPFNGWKVKGKVKKVYIRGKKAFDSGKFLVKKGFGEIIIPS